MVISYAPFFRTRFGENHVLVFFEWNTHANGSTFIGGSELNLKMGFGLGYGGFSCIETMFQMDV